MALVRPAVEELTERLLIIGSPFFHDGDFLQAWYDHERAMMRFSVSRKRTHGPDDERSFYIEDRIAYYASDMEILVTLRCRLAWACWALHYGHPV